MADFINIGNLQQQILKSIAKLCDKNGDGKLEATNANGVREISIFNETRFRIKDNRFTFNGVEYNADGSIFSSGNSQSYLLNPESFQADNFVQNIIGQAAEQRELMIADKIALDDGVLSNISANKEEKRPEINTTSNIINVAKKYGVDPDSIDYDYWVPLIKDLSEKYKISEEIVTALIGKETKGKFTKHAISPKSDGSNKAYGPMQVTRSTTADLFSKYRLDNVYAHLDQQLVQDSIYNDNGSRRFQNATQMRDACAKDDEFGIRIGILCIKEKYAKVVAKLKGIGEKQAILGLKNGTIVLTDEEKKSCLQKAFKLFNGNDTYANDVIRSLEDTLDLNISDLDIGI